MKRKQRPECDPAIMTTGPQSPIQIGNRNKTKGKIYNLIKIKIDGPSFAFGLGTGILASIIAGLLLRLI
jgi:hypothetical protein